MRNIKFDESTVLREFARIAQEQGLVKTAAAGDLASSVQNIQQPPGYQPPTGRGPSADPTQLQQMPKPTSRPGEPMPPTGEPGLFAQNLAQFPNINAFYQSEKVSNPNAFLNELSDKKFSRVSSGLMASQDKAARQQMADLMMKLQTSPALAQIRSHLQKQKQNPQYNPSEASEGALALLTKSSVEDDNMIKSAKEGKEYDVSGETGEDLVGQAHPGGMRTELTHSKTKENLVETIVEQQEADLAVVKKVPKGTYASLVSLYTKLSKMGHKDKLDGLKEIIRAVATPEDVLGHVLVVLADDLDRLGYKKYANQVDGLLKKKALEEYETYGGSVPGEDVGMTDPSGASMPVPTGTEYQPQQAAPATPQTAPVASGLGRGGTPAVQRWQQGYNTRNKLKPGMPGYLKPDGVWGKATQMAYTKKPVQPAPAASLPPEPPPPPPLPVAPGAAPAQQPLTSQQQTSRTDKELAEKRKDLKQTIYGPESRSGRGPVRNW